MDLQQLRVQRTAVSQNSKCEGCVHYDGNAAAKGGACEVGSMPSVCGSGNEKRYGYAPLDELGPEEIDDLATPEVNGTVGAMNEHGNIEKTIEMKRVVLGDEDLSIAQRIKGERSKMSKAFGATQGEVNVAAGAEMGMYIEDSRDDSMFAIAKSLRDLHFAPRKQFLVEKGMPVSDSDFERAGVKKSMVPEVRKLPFAKSR
jgi:hypothetical protein